MVITTHNSPLPLPTLHPPLTILIILSNDISTVVGIDLDVWVVREATCTDTDHHRDGTTHNENDLNIYTGGVALADFFFSDKKQTMWCSWHNPNDVMCARGERKKMNG